MSELKIEKGVPIPETQNGKRGLIGTLNQLEVGDSMLYPLAKRTSISSAWLRIPNKKFTSRAVDEQNIRIWRVE